MKAGTKPGTRIVGCVGTEAGLRRCARKVPGACDMVEVRLDLVGVCGGGWMDLCAEIQARGMPVMLTIRGASQGGEWRGREAERLSLYLAGLRSVSAVDVEIGAHALEILAEAAHRREVEVVGSFHDFEGTPELARLGAVEARGRRMGADVVKIATMVRTPAELALLYALPVAAVLSFVLIRFVLSRVEVSGAIKVFGIVYLCVVFLMACVCIALFALDTHSLGRAVFAAGALLFAASDVFLVFNQFGKKAYPAFRALNLSLYYLGQVCICLTIALMR